MVYSTGQNVIFCSPKLNTLPGHCKKSESMLYVVSLDRNLVSIQVDMIMFTTIPTNFTSPTLLTVVVNYDMSLACLWTMLTIIKSLHVYIWLVWNCGEFVDKSFM